ncbi:MAG: DUF559 domain-containing protein, partial [Actinobacteria bacterium]|nr:DUF559 domain-containing protein [Actinomycetota bacterium]
MNGCRWADFEAWLSTRVGAFTTAQARLRGLTRRQVDAPAFIRPFHGVRSFAREHPDDVHPARRRELEVLRRAEEYAVLLAPGQFFSHTTAALLYGIPLPPLPDEDIHVSVLPPLRAPRGRGVRGHQLRPAGVRLSKNDVGMPLTSAATTWALLGGTVRHPFDLVAAADYLVTAPRVPGPRGRVLREPLVSIEELEAAVLRAPKRRGIVALREALPMVRPGPASRRETWTRMILLDGGLPEPELNHDVYDHDGFVACVDLAYPEALVGVEYEGDQHRSDTRQWFRDIERYERLAAAGWHIVRVTNDMLFSTPETLVRLVLRAL